MEVNSHKLVGKSLPKNFVGIDRPPSQLFISGQPVEEWLDLPKVAIVGSRKMTAYGQYVTGLFASKLAAAGVVIISGLAYGVDAAAHKAALDAGGKTAAVLPTSVDSVYPASHRNLAEQITMNGSLISEYAPGDPVYKVNFTDRNRLVSALADVLLITEAAINSGSLHTARHSLNQGKTVMAVPGNINSPTSEGCNNLIKSGAIAVTELSDVFFALGIDISDKSPRSIRGTEEERNIYSLISAGISNQEELALSAEMDASTLGSILTGLEINGHIKPLGAGHWTTNY